MIKHASLYSNQNSIHYITRIIDSFWSGCYIAQLTHWPLGDLNAILKMSFSILFLLIGIFRSSHDNALQWMPQDLTDDKSALVQVITRANGDPDLCHHMASLGLNELTHCGLVTSYDDTDLISIGLGNGLLPVGTKPLSEPVLTYQSFSGTFTWEQFPMKCSWP